VLVIGLGGLGRQVAATLAGLGVEVWGHRRGEGAAPPGVTRIVGGSELHDALARVDALVVACPYTPETHHLVGAAELAALPAGAFVVNIARGAIIDEAALVDALASRHLGGAALDVFETEPLPATSPLWALPNVLISPHRASVVDAENGLIVDLFVDNLRRYLDGRPLRNVFDPARGY
jgi:phosphoglycerate dehydrogenase-like enzyme